MRLVAGLFAMFLTGSVAYADEAKAPEPKPEATRSKVPLRVVRILTESHQALLFDKNRGTHVLADEGATIEGYLVAEITEDEVVLTAAGKEVVLAAPDPTWRRRGAREATEVEPAAGTPKPKKPAPARTAAEPVDPYAPAADDDLPANPYADAGDAPEDPYAPPAVRSVDAPKPISAPLSPVRVTTAPGRAAPPTSFVAPSAPPPQTAPAPSEDPYADAAVEDEPPPAPVITPTVVSRTELNTALKDFTKLAISLRGSFTPDGAKLALVSPSSVFAKAGLQSGDVVTAVDNTPLKTIDDAAELYVRASSTRAANIHVLRAGKPMTLRVLLQ